MAEHLNPYDCWCNPTIIPVERNDGSIGFVYAHNEQNMTLESNAERTVAIYEAIETVRLQTNG
jgi:hypothetical protein